MTGSAPFNRSHADPRVAIPMVPRRALASPRSLNGAVQMPPIVRPAAVRGSLLKNETVQSDDAAAGLTHKTVPQENGPLSPLAQLCRNSEADGALHTQDPIGTRSSTVSPARPSFSTDTGPNIKWLGAHYVRLGGIRVTELEETQELLNAQYDWGHKILSQRTVYATSKQDTLKMYLCFDGMDDAAAAAHQLTAIGSTWESEYVPFHEFADSEAGAPGETSFYDGQVVFVSTFVGQISQLGTSDVYAVLLAAIEDFGETISLAETAQTSTTLEFRVEYNKISCARAAIKTLGAETPYEKNGWSITTKEMLDRGKEKLSLTTSLLQKEAHLDKAVVHSPSGRTAWSSNAYGHLTIEESAQTTPTALVPRQNPQQFATPGPITPIFVNFDGSFAEPPEHYGRHPQPYQHIQAHHSNADIDLDQIRNGRDVRTTVMLRNIPNSWGYLDLKHRLDQFVHGLYDFSYLRIDFQKHKNVGYGFINLTCAVDIIPLYEGLYDMPWVQSGNPKRKCNMSYATVQSLDCLVDKFRNSAVMAEFPAYTAKMWYTWYDVNDGECNSQSSLSSNQQLVTSYHGSAKLVTRNMVGTERPFPGPDNEAKFQRSNANASQSELWAGNRGRGGFGGYGSHRGSFSNWDRGTTRQMTEDFYNGMPVQGMQFGYPVFQNGPSFVQVIPQHMMGPYFQQQSGPGFGNYGNNNYQHHSGAGTHSTRGGGGHHGRGGAAGDFVSNDARNDARIPRSFSFDNLQAAQMNQGSNRGGFPKRGGFNKRGGGVYA